MNTEKPHPISSHTLPYISMEASVQVPFSGWFYKQGENGDFLSASLDHCLLFLSIR
jgi:hypothetical protein